MTSDADFSIDELADRAGVPTRTVRYYVSEGLLPGPLGRGRQARYTAAHLARLKLVRSLVEQRVPLADQRVYLANLSDDEVRGLLDRKEAEPRLGEADFSPREYVATLLGKAQQARQMPSRPAPSVPPRGFSTPLLQEPAADESWQRTELAPGVELHVRQDAARRERTLIDHIRKLARSMRPGSS